MELRDVFDSWADRQRDHFTDKQWLLSKWDSFEGVEWSPSKIEVMLKSITYGLDLTLPVERLLDLGCGGGWIAQSLSPLANQVVGVDVSLGMLKAANQFAAERQPALKDHLICGEAAHLPFAENTFDRILCYFVFINIHDQDYIRQSILEMWRVLKKGGKALVGQLPDQSQSQAYEEDKEKYVNYCRKHFNLGQNYRDQCYVPVYLFDISALKEFLNAENILFEIQHSFNPFYRAQEAETVPWRLDLILTKN